MTVQSMYPKSGAPGGLKGFALLCLAALSLAVLSVDSRSLWTDEIGTWELTQAGNLSAWARGFWTHYNSDGQLPLYHLYMFIWVQVLGDSELALRASNVPCLLLAFVGLDRLANELRGRLWMILALVSSAFIVYYINDARPYIMYVAGASWLTCGMFRLARALDASATAIEHQAAFDLGLRECLLGAVVLVGGNVLGVFWLLSCLLSLAVCHPQSLKSLAQSMWRQKLWTACGVGLCALIIAVAVHSHALGARASQNAPFSVGGLVYGFLELLGAAGLGPSRNDLRVDVRSADAFQLALMLGLAALSSLAVVRVWWLLCPKRWRWPLALACLAPVLVMVALGLLLHWRVVGRHLSAMLPLLLLGLAIFFREASSGRWGAVWRVLAGVLLLGLVASAVSMRLAPRHMKDDYRQASVWAREALGRGQSVLWIADQRALRYYGLTRNRQELGLDVPVGLIPYTQFPAASIAVPRPSVVLLSPREGVDPEHLARPVLAGDDYLLRDKAASFERYELRELSALTLSKP